MSRLQGLKVFVAQRLNAAVDEIFGHFERTISEYEEELSRRQVLLDALLRPEVKLRRADVQQSLERHKEPSPGPDPQEPTWPPHVKEEREEQQEPWSGREGGRLPSSEEADVATLTLKREAADGEKPRSSRVQGDAEAPASSRTQQGPTQTGAEDRRAPEPASDFDPDRCLQPCSIDEVKRLLEARTGDGDGWTKTGEPQTGVEPLDSNVFIKVLVSEAGNTKQFTCSECRKSFNCRETLRRHLRCHAGERPYSCSVCQKHFKRSGDLAMHMRNHTGEKPFLCGVCGKSFKKSGTLTRHRRIHTGERPHACSFCGKGFYQRGDLTKHIRTHTGEKPFTCGACNRRFSYVHRAKSHKCVVGSGGSQ